MAGFTKKVGQGDPLDIGAGTFNSLIDAADALAMSRHGASVQYLPDQANSNVVLVKNASGADRARFEVLGISGVVIDPDVHEVEFLQRVAVAGVTPLAEHAGRFVILLEPIRAGSVGRAMAGGVCIARAYMPTGEEVAADVTPGDPSKLRGSGGGAASILWSGASAGQTDWAVVRFGGGAAGVTLVKVEKDGGVAGSPTTQCTWTYGIWPYSIATQDMTNDNRIAAGLLPHRARTSVGEYIQAPKGSLGLAFASSDFANGWVLLDALQEVPRVENCTP